MTQIRQVESRKKDEDFPPKKDWTETAFWIESNKRMRIYDAKEEHWKRQNYYFPFANLSRLHEYPRPDVEEAYELRKERREGWSEKHEDDLEYDGGYEAFLEYGNPYEWSDDVDDVCS